VLQVSPNKWRTKAIDLAGATLGTKGWGDDAAIFLGPAGVGIDHLEGVDFTLDGSYVRTEYYVDYDLASTRKNGSANMVNLKKLGTGDHTVTATVRVKGAEPCTVEASFTVAKPTWPKWHPWPKWHKWNKWDTWHWWWWHGEW
jgi:hypothetical protein